jgi:membrane protein implicated in regulation of membrane protease activity
MLVVYLSSLIIGGSLLSLSLFAGGHDADADADGFDHDVGADGFDHDVDAGDLDAAELDGDADVDHDAEDVHGSVGVIDAWLPLTSVRFWTFFLAFFGLVGTALLLTSPMALPLTLIPSGGVGYVSGIAAVRVLRSLARQQIGSTMADDELVGEVGVLLLPVGPEQDGKIRVQVAGRTLELIAQSEDEELKVGDSAVVLGVRDDGGVWVSKAPLLGDGRA